MRKQPGVNLYRPTAAQSLMLKVRISVTATGATGTAAATATSSGSGIGCFPMHSQVGDTLCLLRHSFGGLVDGKFPCTPSTRSSSHSHIHHRAAGICQARHGIDIVATFPKVSFSLGVPARFIPAAPTPFAALRNERK